MTGSHQVLAQDTTGFLSSGPSPTTAHLVGLGSVGRAFLHQIPASVRLVGASDSSGTCASAVGLDPLAIAAFKARWPIAQHPGAESIPSALAVEIVDAAVVVDATDSDPACTGDAVARIDAALRRGGVVATAAKNGLAAAAHRWFGDAEPRVGCNAALGGTGARLATELPRLRSGWQDVAAVPNATTTCVIEGIEAGCNLAEGLERARAQGLLEACPDADLNGTDAAVKLCIVAGALTGDCLPLEDVVRQDLRALDLDVVRERRTRGATTRLIARFTADGDARVAFEEVPLASVFAVPCDRVVYGYRLDAAWRFHLGLGIGPDGTAAALAEDVRRLAGLRRSASAEVVR